MYRWFYLLLPLCCCGCVSLTAPAPALSYRRCVRTDPRPLRVHAVRYDLRSPKYEIVAAVAAPDPDGVGPAETRLAYPEITVSNHALVVAVNANAFSTLAAANGDRPKSYLHGWPVDIAGAVIADGVCRSQADGHANFWMDAAGRPHISGASPPADARQAVAGFGLLLTNGVPAVAPGTHTNLAPRSAVGLDRSRRYLWIVVADGRQEGYSEGLNLYELSELMRELGCHEALNLDGGGSSALFYTERQGMPARLMNSPSQFLTRPVPVMLGIRRRSKQRQPRTPD
ncbi:MAG: phosphodiester glycosidase family protein [Kiritimatiellae bacterium]|nr:phosphodiester glycosidase family protein [Kiritimatiellia bacterium]